MARRDDHTRALTLIAMLVASMVIHVILWPVGDRVVQLSWDSPPIMLSGGVMEVSLVPPDDGDEESREALAEEQPEMVEIDGKLVRLDYLTEEKRPEDTKYVSEFDNTVEEERRAPNVRPRPGQSMTQPGTPDASEGRSQNPSRQPDRAQALALGQRDGSANEGQGDQGAADPTSRSADGSLAENPGQAGGGGKAGLRGNPDAMRKTFGTPGSYDDLDGIKEGNANLINSKRWRFASFFNRVRNSVAQHWHPEVVHAARDPEGRVHGKKTRITRLRIRLNKDGSVHKISIEKPCGVDYLDEEAIRAVRTAQPFNNPPPQLVDPDSGFIDFGFGFIFEITDGGARIFRYRR